jgi:hypothetical protein
VTSCLKLISQLIAPGGSAQNLIFRAVCPEWERDCSTLNDLFVKKFQCGLWFQSDLLQAGFGLAFQFGVNTSFGYCAHVPNATQTWTCVKQSERIVSGPRICASNPSRRSFCNQIMSPHAGHHLPDCAGSVALAVFRVNRVNVAWRIEKESSPEKT